MGRIITTQAAYTDLGVSRPRGNTTTPPTVGSACLHPSGTIRIGDAAVAGDPIIQYVLAFEFPALIKGTFVSSVDFSIQLESLNHTDGAITHNADLWITGHNRDLGKAAPYYLGSANGIARGAGGPDGTNLVQPGFFTPASKPGTVSADAAGAEVLKNSVNAFLAAVYGQDRAYAGGDFLCLRLNCDRPPTGGNATSGYQVFTSASGKPATLKLTIA